MSSNGFTRMSIYGINLDLFSSSPIVILKVEEENRYLPIWIGQPEARSILMKLQNQDFSRPLTHDLALSLVSRARRLDGEDHGDRAQGLDLLRHISLQIGGRTIEVDSRPSDAIALAVRSGAEIYASDDVIEEAAVVFEEAMEEAPEDEVVDKFKDWMNQRLPGRLQVASPGAPRPKHADSAARPCGAV